MEDTQPNEVRLSRKGSTNIPRVRITRPFVHTSSYPKRPRWQPPATRAPLPGSRTNRASEHELIKVHLHLPLECHRGAPGSYNARKRWIEDQKYHLRTDRHLSVLSFKYSDHDNRVLFTCRAQQAAQSTGHYATGYSTGLTTTPSTCPSINSDSLGTGSHLVNTHLDTERTGILRQAEGSYSDLAQSGEPGPSRIRPTSRTLAGLGGCTQRLDNQPSIPSSGYSVETKFVEPFATEIKSHPVQIRHTNPVPRRRAAVHTASPTESVIDLTLDHPGRVVEEHSARWSTFRSGYMNISLPAFSSGPIISSPEANTSPRPSINQTPARTVGRREDMPVVRSSDTNPRIVHPNIRTNDTASIRSMEDHPNYPCNYSVVLKDRVEMHPSAADYSPSVPGFTSGCGNILLSLGSHDKPRRVLHLHGFTYVVTAHGIIDQVGTTSVLKLDRHIRSPSLPFEEFVDDTCILSHQGDPVILLGHAREQNQIAFLNLGRGQVSRHITLRRDWNPAKRPGVSAMTSLMSPLKFASGGYDHRVHLWDIAQDVSGASAVELAIKHTSLIHSLLPIVDTSHKLISVGADCDIPIYDLSAERVLQTLKTSCTPYHAHKTDFSSCTLLEVSHLETQFEIRDHRMPNQAVQRFGFLTEEKRGRFEKADSWLHFVACGDRNGAVHLWDLRNVSTEVALRQCFSDPVIQVVSTGPRLLACSKRNELACINFQGE